MKTLLPLLILLFVSFGVRAQNAELVFEKGVEAHREIDEIYRRVQRIVSHARRGKGR